MKNKLLNNKYIKKIKKFFSEFKENPMEKVIAFFKGIGKYFSNNSFFCIYVVLNVLNALLLRVFTINNVENIFSIQPILADLTVVVIFGAFGYLMSQKKRSIYWIVLTFIFTVLCVINSVYYTFYTSFSSISLLTTSRFIVQVGDAVVENVLQPKDFLYILMPFILIFVYAKMSKQKKFKSNGDKVPKQTLKTLGFGVACLLVFISTLTATDIGRLTKQWNREYIVMKYGIYIYHINDLFKSIEPKLTSLFGYDEAVKNFNEYFKDTSEEAKTNKYTGIYEGKNVLVIHAESIQNFVINLKINGEELTPNLNKLAKNGIYFDNYYSQVSVGTSSDAEFTFLTSLMPSNTGTAFGSYFDREYVSTPKLLKEKGYYTFAMHGNNADYWNRRTMHQNLGYDDLIAKADYEIDEVMGLGISDKSFLKQSAEKLQTIHDENDKFYGTIITLTNHTPFNTDGEAYSDFDVTLKVEEYNEEIKKKETVTYPYMEGTKLGYYLKSVHYADEALGEFLDDLDKRGILDDTVIVLYGDHDARLPVDDYLRFYNYDKTTDGTLPETSEGYKTMNSYEYEMNRKVPFIIWSKEEKYKEKVSNVMGMYDAMPTLGNMFGFYNKYALGNDIFNIKDDNIVVFPTGNWVTNKVYYNAQKGEYLTLKESVITDEYIKENNEYAEKLLSVSNSVIVYDLLKKDSEEKDESELIEGAKK